MRTGRPRLLIDPARGMAGDMFSAALLSLGVPADVVVGAMEKAARRLGPVSIEPETVPAGEAVITFGDGLRPGRGAAVKDLVQQENEAMAVRLHIRLEPDQPRLLASKAWGYLEEAIMAVGLVDAYANFARRTLGILVEAEREVHSGERLPVMEVPGTFDHLEMPRRGISHQHATGEAVLHEAQDILLDVVGAAVGLQYLNVNPDRVVCLSPVRVGGGFVTFSHGRLPVPAPATQAILDEYGVPYAAGPLEKELLTPTGASLLAALQPEFRPRDGPVLKPLIVGIGRGLHRIEPPGDLRLGLWWEV